MARGGRRQGTPGKAYSNRSDLNTARAPQSGLSTAAAGGMTADVPQAAPMDPPQQRPNVTPDDTPNLLDPGNPEVPLTAGLATGAGPGPQPDPAVTDAAVIAKYLPSLQEAASWEGAPDTFRSLVRYLQGA